MQNNCPGPDGFALTRFDCIWNLCLANLMFAFASKLVCMIFFSATLYVMLCLLSVHLSFVFSHICVCIIYIYIWTLPCTSSTHLCVVHLSILFPAQFWCFKHSVCLFYFLNCRFQSSSDHEVSVCERVRSETLLFSSSCFC